MKIVLLTTLLFVSEVVAEGENFHAYKPNPRSALEEFFKEIEQRSESSVPDQLLDSLKSRVFHSLSMHVNREHVPEPPQTYRFWHDENAEFVFGGRELLLDPSVDFWLISISPGIGTTTYCKLNLKTYKIEAVYQIPEG